MILALALLTCLQNFLCPIFVVMFIFVILLYCEYMLFACNETCDAVESATQTDPFKRDIFAHVCDVSDLKF